MKRCFNRIAVVAALCWPLLAAAQITLLDSRGATLVKLELPSALP